MEDEYTSYLPLYDGDNMDKLNIVQQMHQIRQLVIDNVDASIKYEQLKGPQLYGLFIKPIIENLKIMGLNGGTLYCLLANVDQFQKQSFDEPAISGLCRTRAASCELICTKLLREYKKMQIAEALTFDFYPLSDGTETVQAPAWLRMSAIELALHTQSKHLLSHPSVIELVQDLWNGKLTFDTYLNKSHRFNLNSREEMGLLVQNRRGIVHPYSFRNAGLFRLSRLRVPKYRAFFRTLSMVGFMIIYFQYSINQGKHENWMYGFYIYGLGLVIDELIYVWTVGPGIYFTSLWNVCDALTFLLFGLYIILSPSYPNLGKDILATMAITLVPRMFGVFDGNESFSKMLISVHRMSIDLGVSWLIITLFSVGFWAAFAFSFSKDFYSPQVVAYDFVRIMFGYTGAGWDQWDFYHIFGKSSLLAYLFLTQFVVRPILTAVLSDTYSHINEHSTLEYNYLRALNTVSKLKTEANVLFFFVPPLNLLELLLYPTVYVLPYKRFLVLNRTILKITHFPLLLGIFIYENVSWRLTSYSEHANQTNRLKQIASIESFTNTAHQPNINIRTAPRPNASINAQGVDMRTVRKRSRAFSNYALLDELFNNPVLSVKYGQSVPVNTLQTQGFDESGITEEDDSRSTVEGIDERLTRLENTAQRIEKMLLELNSR